MLEKMFKNIVCSVIVLLLYSFQSVNGKFNFNQTDLTLLQNDLSTLMVEGKQINFVNGHQFFNQFSASKDSNEIPSSCLAQLIAIVNDSSLLLKFIDSWGKIPSGLLKGNLYDMGNFNECLDIKEQLKSNDQLNGKYCLSQIPVGSLVNAPTALRSLKLNVGICFPEACSAATINTVLKELLNASFNASLDAKTTLVKEINCTKGEVSFTTLDWVTVILLSLIGFLLVLSTTLDYVNEYFEKPLHPLLSAFSIRINARQLFHMRVSKNNPHIIPCLNGIRVISIVWIILGHAYLMVVIYMATDNTLDILDWARSPFAMLIMNAFPSVDTFFFLSGLLLGMIGMREMEKNRGKLNVPLMFLHRFLRLTPALAVAVLVYMSIFRYMANGPLWNSAATEIPIGNCDKSWWATLLYVQNYVYPNEMCLGHTWYLSVDTQLYFFSPLALIALGKWGNKGLAALAVVVLLFFACLFSIIMVHDISVFGGLQASFNGDRFRLTYNATHARVNPWLIGLMFGYYLHCQKGRRVTLPKWVVLLGWIVSLGLLVTIIYSLYPKAQPGTEPLTPLESAFYLSLSRIAWPLALCWVVFACVNGYGGPINEFLSWSYWEPLSKLTYSMYIWHFMIENITAGRVKSSFHFSDYDMILRFWRDFGLTVIVAFVMHLAVEAPMAGIEKTIFKPQEQSKIIIESKNDAEAPPLEFKNNIKNNEEIL